MSWWPCCAPDCSTIPSFFMAMRIWGQTSGAITDHLSLVDTNGVQEWGKTYGTFYREIPEMCCDDLGRVYVPVTYHDGGFPGVYSSALFRYLYDGTEDLAISLDIDRVNSVTVSPFYNIVVCGDGLYAPNCWMQAFNESGSELWQKTSGIPRSTVGVDMNDIQEVAVCGEPVSGNTVWRYVLNTGSLIYSAGGPQDLKMWAVRWDEKRELVCSVQVDGDPVGQLRRYSSTLVERTYGQWPIDTLTREHIVLLPNGDVFNGDSMWDLDGNSATVYPPLSAGDAPCLMDDNTVLYSTADTYVQLFYPGLFRAATGPQGLFGTGGWRPTSFAKPPGRVGAFG